MCISTKYNLLGVTGYSSYENGALKECRVNTRNVIHTAYGDFVPQCQSPDERTRESKSISFHPNGSIQGIRLEEAVKIKTSVGTFSAELVTFYEDGSLDSLFPLDNQPAFDSTGENKAERTPMYDFDLPIGKFSVRMLGIRFFANGNLRSLTLCPKENITIMTPIGEQSVRIGFRLYENGALHSFEPSFPTPIMTPIGEITAFDQLALGADADSNSVRFDPAGNLISISTNSDFVVKNRTTGQRECLYQNIRFGLKNDAFVKIPVKLLFDQSSTTIIDNGTEAKTFKDEEYSFLALYDGSFKELKCSPGSDCSNCGAGCM